MVRIPIDNDPKKAKSKDKTHPRRGATLKKEQRLAEGLTEQSEGLSADASPPLSNLVRYISGVRWLLLGALLLIVGGAYFTYPQWHEKLDAILSVMPFAKMKDAHVADLGLRVARLETASGRLQTNDQAILRLEAERNEASARLAKVLTRLDAVERSMMAVRNMAEAAASMDQAGEAKASLKSLSDRLLKLEKGRSTTLIKDEGAEKQRIAITEQKGDEIAKRLSKLEAGQTTAELAERMLQGMEKRLNAVESRSSPSGITGESSVADAALILAVGNLRDAVRLGGSYQQELFAIETISGDDAALSAALLPLSDYKSSGIPTLNTLRLEFSKIAGPIVVSARSQKVESWLGKVFNNLSSVVTVRRTDGVGEDQSVETMVAKVEGALINSELAVAVSTLEGVEALSESAGKIAAPWLSHAKIRLRAERALAALHIHAAALLKPRKE
ncbi:MAG: hypothetical protein CBB68_06315 [Rhodospirillaceae bacterium TMED8]|nr:hypothetical protein [Magnetovibrio sp.]OUT51234.1 MAG: hypothetical protein CBB68_06315 [Rhodospirillaceae bacterium TMED8]